MINSGLISKIAIVICLIWYRPMLAAELSVSKGALSEPVIRINGEIETGDLNKIKKLSASVILSEDDRKKLPIVYDLSTPGGNIEEAIKIGKFFREILASVDVLGRIVVASGSNDAEKLEPIKDQIGVTVQDVGAPLTDQDVVRNYSAGVLIFYGAVKRMHRDNVDRREGMVNQKIIPVMGIHRPYYDKEAFSKLSPSEAAQAYKKLETEVRTYLSDMGAPQAIIDRMFNKSSKEIELIPDTEFRKFYKEEESFLQEWLIAKCGQTGSKNALKGQELDDFINMDKWQIKSRSEDTSKKSYDYLYKDQNYPDDYVLALYTKVREHNLRTQFCTNNAVASHQREWATAYLKKLH